MKRKAVGGTGWNPRGSVRKALPKSFEVQIVSSMPVIASSITCEMASWYGYVSVPRFQFPGEKS
jgi:hypothetical protein